MTRQRGFSLLELLAVVTIIGIIAGLVVPRIVLSTDKAEEKSCFHNRSQINSAAERFGVVTGSNPTVISDLETDDYFPTGIPVCPVTGSAYTLNSTTNRVEGHTTSGSPPGDH